MNDLLLPRPRGFALRAVSDFYAGFVPGSGMAAAAPGRLTLVFRLDRTFEAVGAELAEDPRGLVVRITGTDDGDAVARQLSRMLGLAEGDGWLDVGARDPIAGALQASFPGFFTAAKASPYDAAAWGIIAARLPMPVAARIKSALAEALGDRVSVGGRTHAVFPSPQRLLEAPPVPGLSPEKLERLRGVARAAIAGRLDATTLRAMGEESALADLSQLRGVGPWTAGHIYFRGAAPPDGLPLSEPRVLHGFAAAYGRPPTAAALTEAAESFRPYRMWMSILFARHFGRVGGSRARLTEERRRAPGARPLVRARVHAQRG